MSEKDTLNLDLEDIIREFSAKPGEEKLSQTEEMEDTIPLDDLVDVLSEQEEKSEDTMVFAPVDMENDQRFEAMGEETQIFDAVTQEDISLEPTMEMPALEETAEEAEEEEITEPKRLRTPFQIMRRKIVEGPERQYYALREKGIAKLQTVLFFSFLVAVLAAGTAVLYSLGYIPESRLRLMIFGQILLMLISALLGAFQMVDGLFLIAKLRFRPNTLLFFTFLACGLDGIFCLKSLRVPCCAVFCIQVFMSLWGVCMQRKTDTCRTDTMRSAKSISGIAVKKDYFEGVKAFMRCDGDVDHFMDNYGKEGAPEKTLGIYCFAAFLAALAVGCTICVLSGLELGLQIFAAALMMAMPATMFITLERPARLLERKFYKLGVVLCGWNGIKGFAGKAVFPITHQDIFPAGTVKLNGVKFYGEIDPATVVGYAAAVAEKEEGSLAPVFAELKENYNIARYELESFRHYAGGIGGGVEGAVVLIGTLPMLKAMQVEIPEDLRLPSGVGVAINGKFACLVAVNYEKSRPVSHGLRVLCGYTGLKPVLISNDLVLTGAFMKKKFGVKPKKLRRPEPEERNRLQNVAADPEDPVLSLAVRPTLAAYGYTIAGARAMRLAIVFGVALHILGGILGLGAVAVLAFLGETALLTPANLLLYQAIWLIPGFLMTEWTRSI